MSRGVMGTDPEADMRVQICEDSDIPAINTFLLALQKFSHVLEEDVSYFDKFYQHGQMLALV